MPVLLFLLFLILACFDISGDYVLAGAFTPMSLIGGSWESGLRGTLSALGIIGFVIACASILLRSTNSYLRLSFYDYTVYSLLLVLLLLNSFLISFYHDPSYLNSASLELISLGMPPVFVLLLIQLRHNFTTLFLCRFTLIVFLVSYGFKLAIALIVSQTFNVEVVFKLSSLVVPFFVYSLFLPLRTRFALVHVISCSFCLFVLFSTGQRGFLIASVLSSAIFFAIKSFSSISRKNINYLHFTWLLVSLLLSVFLLPVFLDSFTDIGTIYRFQQVRALYDSFLSHPLLGLGLGQPPANWDSFLDVYKTFQMELDFPYLLIKLGLFQSILYALSLYFLFLHSFKVRSAILDSPSGSTLERQLSLDFFALRPEIFTVSILMVSLFQTSFSSLIINFYISFFYFYQVVLLRVHVPSEAHHNPHQ